MPKKLLPICEDNGDYYLIDPRSGKISFWSHNGTTDESSQDRGLEYEQNQATLPIAVIVLLVKSNTIESLRPLLPSLQDALRTIQRGVLIKLSGSL